MTTSFLTKWRHLSSELHDYLSAPITADAAVNGLRAGLVQRSERFLTMLRGQIYRVPESPYMALLRAARVTFDQVANWVERDGLESALGRLVSEGVWLSVDEFKGRRPIRRGALEFAVRPGSFDPRSSTVGFEALGGQSRSRGTPSSVSFALLTEEAMHLKVLLSQLGAERGLILNWRPILPASAGTKFTRRFVKIGCPLDAWWSHVPVSLLSRDRGRWRTRLIVYLARLHGAAIPRPEYVPLSDAARVVRWAREQQRRGTTFRWHYTRTHSPGR